MHYMNLQTKMHMHETWINAQNQRNIYDGNKFQVCNRVWQREYFIYLCDGAYLCMHAWTVFSFKVQGNFVQHHYLTLLLFCFKPSSQFQLGTEMIWPNIKKIQHKMNEYIVKMNSTTKLWNFLKCGWDFHYIYLPLTLISMIFKVFLSEIPKVQNLKRFSQEIHCWLVNNCAHDYLSSFLNLLTRLIILLLISLGTCILQSY